MSTEENLRSLLEFLRSAEQLKNTHRSSRTSEGKPESVAEHTWRLCLMALLFEDSFPDSSFQRLIKLCIVHDLGEAIGGDIPAPEQDPRHDKSEQERNDLFTLTAGLPDRQRETLRNLWIEYEEARTPEARIAKALDKLETILQHNQGLNPPDFDYRFNLDYGQEYTSEPPLIAEIRRLLDKDTLERAQTGEDSE